jgi:hypothetical protein
VLFHLTEPIAGLREAARIVRIGGTVGTVTWASEEAPVASRVWDETLNRLDVAALPAHGNHSGLDTEDAIAQLFVSAQIQPQRIWRVPVRHRFTAESFWHLRTGTGTNRARLAALAPGRREAVLGDLRARLAELAPDDYEFRGSVIGAVAERVAP